MTTPSAPPLHPAKLFLMSNPIPASSLLALDEDARGWAIAILVLIGFALFVSWSPQMTIMRERVAAFVASIGRHASDRDFVAAMLFVNCLGIFAIVGSFKGYDWGTAEYAALPSLTYAGGTSYWLSLSRRPRVAAKNGA